MSLSLCMIVKNEERCILRCLESIVGVVDEMIIVDTGSTDGTKAIIGQFKLNHPEIDVKLLDFEWIDDFSAARNFALSKATGTYILHLDADDYLLRDDLPKLLSLKKFLLKQKKPYLIVNHYLSVRNNVVVDDLLITRIFPNHPLLRYKRVVHESIDDGIRAFQGLIKKHSSIRFIHDGYDPAVVDEQAKLKRNIKLLNKAIQRDPNDYVSLIFFGREMSRFDLVKGLNLLYKVLPMVPVDDKFWYDYCSKLIRSLEHDFVNYSIK